MGKKESKTENVDELPTFECDSYENTFSKKFINQPQNETYKL